MASDGSPGAILGASPVLNGPASAPSKFQTATGKTLPQSGSAATASTVAAPASGGNALPQSGNRVTQTAAPSAASRSTGSSGDSNANSAKSAAASSSDPQTLVDQVNKFLNDSGRPDEFRVDPTSDKYIQQVNPSNGEVVAEYSVSEFPALARSVGASGLLIDDVA